MISRRSLQRALLVFGVWTAFGLLIGQQTVLQLHARHETRPLLPVFASPVVAAWMWALFTPLAVAATRRLRRLRALGWTGWAASFAGHAVVAALLCLTGTTAWVYIRPLIDGVHATWLAALAGGIFFDTASYIAVAALTEAITFAAQYHERDIEAAALAHTAADLQSRLDEARLHALESQLRPHFLYNTLNLIAELVHDEPDAADEMLTRLGLLLRRAYRAEAHVIPLGEELAFVLAYAEILARRYRDRVRLSVDVPSALRELPVPAFALQPLVENAFRHGVERRERGSEVEIGAQVRDGALVLRVRDRATTGPHPGARWDRTRRTRRRGALDTTDPSGVGLRNTRERLRALYGSHAGLTLDRDPGETTATLWLPADSPSTAPSPVSKPVLVATPELR